MRNLTLRAPQIPMVNFMRATKRCNLWAGMGTGKTSGVLYTIDWLKLLSEIGGEPTLVVGPMRVARDTWPNEVTKWTNFRDMKIVPLTGVGPAQRVDRLRSRDVDIFTINYELLEWLVEHYMERWPFRNVIADESDRLKGLREKKGGINLQGKKKGGSASRAFQVARVAHNLVDRWINLTGTPAPAGLKDLWGQNWYVDRGARLGRTHGAFMDRWFRPKWSGHGVEPMPFAHDQIHAALRDVTLTIDPKDYFDIDDPIRTIVEVDLPKRARAIYKDLSDELYAKIEELGAEINAFNSAVLTNKCLQLANGAVYTKRPEWVPVHDAKLEALESVVHECAGNSLLVSYAYQSDKTRILRAFKSAVDISTTSGLRAFMAGDKQLGIAHPKSMGHGVDGLQKVCSRICFYGHDWKTGERDQYIARIGPMRQLQEWGEKRPVWVYDIVARDTEDENVMEVHKGNTDVQDVLLAAMKRRRKNATP